MKFDPDKQLTVQSLPNEQEVSICGLQVQYEEVKDIPSPPPNSISYYGIGFADYDYPLRIGIPIVLYYWYSEENPIQETGVVSDKHGESGDSASFTIQTTVDSYQVELFRKDPIERVERDVVVTPDSDSEPLDTSDVHILPISDHYVAMATGNGHLTTATQL